MQRGCRGLSEVPTSRRNIPLRVSYCCHSPDAAGLPHQPVAAWNLSFIIVCFNWFNLPPSATQQQASLSHLLQLLAPAAATLSQPHFRSLLRESHPGHDPDLRPDAGQAAYHPHYEHFALQRRSQRTSLEVAGRSPLTQNLALVL